VKLPAEGICKSEPVSRSSSRRSRVNIQLPLSAIAGVTGDDFVKFEDYQDEKEHIVPVNLCWTTSGDLIVSSARGQLLRVIYLSRKANNFKHIKREGKFQGAIPHKS